MAYTETFQSINRSAPVFEGIAYEHIAPGNLVTLRTDGTYQLGFAALDADAPLMPLIATEDIRDNGDIDTEYVAGDAMSIRVFRPGDIALAWVFLNVSGGNPGQFLCSVVGSPNLGAFTYSPNVKEAGCMLMDYVTTTTLTRARVIFLR